MIILDTHFWVWWIHGSDDLTVEQLAFLDYHASTGLGISAISCWEIAKLVERRRLSLPLDLEEWLEQALSYEGVEFIELSPKIAVESTRLPGKFHRDPADQIIVATARVLGLELASRDEKIQKYPHVGTLNF
ncbi:MAG: type II toxin-antitoxin system VapC family toxin [Bradymonadaceae bacterium]